MSDSLQQIIAISLNNPKHQQLDQHTLLKQVLIVNEQFALLRASQVWQASQKLSLENQVSEEIVWCKSVNITKFSTN